jgi:hypothetical protein
MDNLRMPSLFLGLVFCLSLLGSSSVFCAVPDNTEVGAKLIESKIDYMISYLRDKLKESEQKDLVLADDFRERSGLLALYKAMMEPDSPLYQYIKEAGDLHAESLKDPNKSTEAYNSLDQAISKIFEELLKNPDLDDEMRKIISALNDTLNQIETAEGYTRPGIITSAAGDNKGTGKDPVELETVAPIPPEPEDGNFRYYGKLYDLDTEVTFTDDGVLWFSSTPGDIGQNEIATPFLTPFFSGGGLYPPIVSEGVVSSTKMSNVAVREYSWQVSRQEIQGNGDSDYPATVTAKLFENPDNPTIVFDYYNSPEVVASFKGYLYGGMAGLHPGDGSPGTPGEGVPRDPNIGIDALSKAIQSSPVHLYQDPQLYTPMSNLVNNVPTDIPLDSFFVFVPDRWNIAEDSGPIYSVTFGGRNLVVGSDSVDQAINDVIDDKGSFDKIMAGEFCEESTYKDYKDKDGVLTIGDLLPGVFEAEDALNNLKNDGLLAYIFKYEEYLINKEIIKNANMEDSKQKADLMKGSATAIASIRDMDAALEEMQDAKANFVQKDIHGNWVRTQQWMLRPNNTQIQLLNITYRGSGELKGASGMDFSVFLTESYSRNLSAKDLPWDSWLGTRKNKSGVKYIENCSKSPELESMYVKLFNPGGEYMKEERSFDPRVEDSDRQYISNEELTLANEEHGNTYDYDNGGNFDANEYRIEPGTGKFNYVFGDSNLNHIQVAFFAVGDGTKNGITYPYPLGDISDIWDALRVNSQHGPHIFDNNLEIIANEVGDKYKFFKNSIDIIYVPMNRMIWKEK